MLNADGFQNYMKVWLPITKKDGVDATFTCNCLLEKLYLKPYLHLGVKMPVIGNKQENPY